MIHLVHLAILDRGQRIGLCGKIPATAMGDEEQDWTTYTAGLEERFSERRVLVHPEAPEDVLWSWHNHVKWYFHESVVCPKCEERRELYDLELVD